MSRFSEYDGDGEDGFNGNGGYMWEKRAQLALEGKRGRKALADLREALLALPEKRLIARALCTVGGNDRVAREMPDDKYGSLADERKEVEALIAQQGEGVCAIGAYVWHQKVKAGMTPQQAFDDLPTVADIEHGGDNETAQIGKDHGLTYTLAWELASRNDEQWIDLTPEQRYITFLHFIDRQLAKPPLARPAPKAKLRAKLRAIRKAEAAATRARAQQAVGQITLPL